MLRQLITRTGGLALVALVLTLACFTSSCGGGGSGTAAKDMVLVEFLFVDRALVPTAPTGTENLPRNAQILLVFSEKVDPNSVTNQTVQVRFGPTGQSVPQGSFSVDGNTIRFDPTVTAQGQPNPFGFASVVQYTVDIPNFQEQPGVVRNLDNDPNLVTFFSTFVTSDGFLRELNPPEVEKVESNPPRFQVNPLTGQWPGNSVMEITFNEPMDPASFILGGAGGPDVNTTIDVRYVPWAQINIDNGLVNPPDPTGTGAQIPGYFEHDASAQIYRFIPTFSFGDKKYVFAVQVFQGLKDLSGNLLVNPRSFGPYTCDGNGRETGKILLEDFTTNGNVDFSVTDADWGFTEEGVLQGQAISSREAYIFGYTFQGAGPRDIGQYAAIISPMIGAALNTFQSNVSPPTNLGRRVMWAFSDTEMGQEGSVTAAGWGPDSNATFAAIYPDIFLRCGFQKQNSLSLSPSFAGNYEGSPTVVYTGSYQVPQSQNVGNTISTGGDPGGYQQNPGCQNILPWNGPLWDNTGFQAWPEFTTFFDWNEGDPLVVNDRVFIFDASVDEGDTWQQVRGWFAAEFPCAGILIQGFPNRRMYTTYEEDTPDPPANFAAGILNPEPSVTDSSFTITKRISLAQTLWYTDGNQPANSTATTFGKDSDYLREQFSPAVQAGGAQVVIEFQAADAVEADRRTVNAAAPFLPDWVDDANACDGFACIRWRMFLISNLISQQVARLYTVAIPVVDAE